jgi:hypothetical protein
VCHLEDGRLDRLRAAGAGHTAASASTGHGQVVAQPLEGRAARVPAAEHFPLKRPASRLPDFPLCMDSAILA